MNRLLLYLVIVLFLGSCSSSKHDNELLIIASEQGDCVGVAPMKCLLVKNEEQSEWQFFYNSIEGFNYEPGYEYVIEVKSEVIESPAADQSSIRYILVKEVSKTKKKSENLPTLKDEITPVGDEL
ncbi:DUF4377 domain-containing protein [Dysgonomonas sp. 216]|uniref:DUF4377 domain-containing protein n=1 Tax=Dysgonomonas sp. 216 TaxID=2302934 RepID=UPI0013D15FE7|nr:DUF4377 domain-containing protein [Dysgonomonas sp. 216]NDW18359.1 DUF4377 domain-containing protein [Dysgonomonas sp. 216]NDW18727.1 DUF4377 domain-containing protein [Dysgonomonas sp. 216]